MIFCYMNLRDPCNLWKPLEHNGHYKIGWNMKMLPQNKHDFIRSNGLYVFLNSFGDHWPYANVTN
jgi:hypothetical protein